MGAHLRVLSESFQMNTNMAGFIDGYQESSHSCALDKSSLSIGRVKATAGNKGAINPCYACRPQWISMSEKAGRLKA